MKFSISEINKILGVINFNGSLNRNLIFNKVNIDSRNISAEDLFIAIKGENYDGHDFLQDVLEKGIKAVVIKADKQHLLPSKYPFWAVHDTKEAFQNLALFKRRKLNIPVVAITGSVGKTTTKEMSLEVLKNFGKIKVSEKNNNNEFGVALTIHSCDGSEDLMVLEMGMRGRGQIEILSKLAEPDIAVITNIGSSHIGILGSRDHIAKAKCEITSYLKPNGLVIIPHDDPLLDKNLEKVWKGKVVKVKISNKCKRNKVFSLKDKFIFGLYDSSQDIIEIDNKKFQISFKGIHNAFNFLFVYAISKEIGIKFEKFNKYNFRILSGRNKIIHTQKLTIMDESYNASPESVRACIEVLLKYKGRHFLILGSIMELGTKSINYHKKIMQFITNSDIHKCIFLCEYDLEESLKKSCRENGNIIFINERDSIIPLINEITNKGDYLLIKGSRFWQLNKLLPYIN